MSCVTYDSGIELSEEDEPRSKKRQLTLKLQLAYGVGHVFNDVGSSVWFSYLLIFMNLVIRLKSWQSGLLLLVGQIADASANPLIGYLSDRTFKNCFFERYGKRKSWHLIGTLLSTLTYPFTLLKCLGCEDSPKTFQFVYYALFVSVYQFGWAAVQNSHLALIPELSNNENDRTKLAATRYFFTVFSNLLVYITSWISFRVGESEERSIGPWDAYKFANIAWITMCFGIITSIIFHTFVKEGGGKSCDLMQGDNPKLQSVLSLEEITAPRPSFATIAKESKYYKAAILYMSTMLFINMGQVFVPLYLHESLKMSASSLAVVPLIIYATSLLATFFVEKMNVRLGRKAAYLVGASIGLMACLWVQLRSQSEYYVTYEIYGVAVFFGIANCIIMVTNLVIASDVVGSKNGNGALLYGLMTLCDKLSSGFAVFFIEYLHSKTQDELFYQNAVAVVCGSAVLLASSVVIFLMKLPKKKHGYIEIH